MKPRKWIFTVFILILLTSGGFYFGKLFIEKNRNIEDLFITYFSPLIGGKVNVKKVSIGFFSLFLNEVELSIPLQYYSLSIENIKIGFSFFQLLKTRGDLKKSINKIIFVNPTVSISSSQYYKKSDNDFSLENLRTIHKLPVQYVLIQNCRICFKDYTDNEVIIGEQLSGKLWVQNKELKFELNGKLSAKKQNLFISGLIPDSLKQQYISIRLDKARIVKPILFKNFSLFKGTLDGICKVTFSDSTFPYNINTQGAVKISEGVAEVNGVNSKFEDIMAMFTFRGNSVNIDSISARWNGVNVLIKGYTGLFQNQKMDINLRLNGLEKELLPRLPRTLLESVSGKGWFELNIVKSTDNDIINSNFSFGGMYFHDRPLYGIFGECSFNDKRVSIDTVLIGYSDLSVGLKGKVYYEKTPFVYSFSLNSFIQTANFIPEMNGGIKVSASIKGTGGNPDIQVLLDSKNIKYNDIDFGNTAVSMNYFNDTIVFRSTQNDKVKFNIKGKIYDIINSRPYFLFHTHIGKELFVNILQKNNIYYPKILTNGNIDATVNGTIENYQVEGTLFCDSGNLNGNCRFEISYNDSLSKYKWLVNSDSLTINHNSQSFELFGAGSVLNTTINIDTFSIPGYVSGNGTVTLGNDKLVLIEYNSCQLSYKKINSWFPRTIDFIDNGFVKFKGKMNGTLDNPNNNINLSIRECSIAGLSSLETDAIINIKGRSLTILPFVVRKNNKAVIFNDTLKYIHHISSSGSFYDIDIDSMFQGINRDGRIISGKINGQYSTSEKGLPVKIRMRSDEIKMEPWGVDSVAVSIEITKDGLLIDTINGVDSTRLKVTGNGIIPWSFITNDIKEKDTLCARLEIKGDILKSIENNFQSPVGGSGLGEIIVDFCINSEQWHFNQAYAYIPKGDMKITPFVPDDVKNIFLKVSMDNDAKLNMRFSGNVNNRPVKIENSHLIPKGHKPLFLGSINCGVLQVRTPEKGMHLFLPGFMERVKENKADIEFGPKDSLQAFTISGPVDRLRISGTWIIRSAEFTFPFIDEEPPPEDDPFPYITWDLNLKAGNRKLIYFYNLGRKNHTFIRFVECVVDPSVSMSVLGRDADGTFRLLGGLRSYKGSVFYGKNFDRNFTLGLDFSPQKVPGEKGYNNLPIIWGSAEAMSSTNRYDRIKLTLLTRDSSTGVLREKGRFSDISFRISSEFKEIPGETEMDFYRSAGLNFITLKSAGEVVSGISDQYIKKYLFQRFERKLASRLGLDVISFETSIASNYFNYFYNYQKNRIEFSKQWNYLTFANVGITLGRYFLRDKVFIKWRTELIPDNLVLIPEHSVGFEYQPSDFFWIDFNYAIHRNKDIVEYNPKFLMQFRLPINAEKFRNIFNFSKK